MSRQLTNAWLLQAGMRAGGKSAGSVEVEEAAMIYSRIKSQCFRGLHLKTRCEHTATHSIKEDKSLNVSDSSL